MNKPFYSFDVFLKKRFPGVKIAKIPIAAGLSCPNRDGTLSRSGCIFCDGYASGPVRGHSWSIERQIEDYIQHHPGRKYIAYFQSHCNTTGPVDELRKKYEIVFRYKEIVGLFIATRPDAIPEPVWPLLEEIGQRTYLAVELGLQSIHPRSLMLLNRNHTYDQFEQAFCQLQARGLDVIVHLIIGIPGETLTHMRETIAVMNRLKPAGVKFHLFHVLRGTELHEQHLRSPLPLLSQDEYVAVLADLLERLDPDIVIHRLTAEREKELFVAPLWALNKLAVLNAITDRMNGRGTIQGRALCEAASPGPLTSLGK